MINFTTFAAAYCLFHVTHGIADYWLQTNWMAKGKSKSWFNVELFCHAFVYSIAFIPALMLLGTSAAEAVLLSILAIGFPHAMMDNRKFMTWWNQKTKGWMGPKERVFGAWEGLCDDENCRCSIVRSKLLRGGDGSYQSQLVRTPTPHVAIPESWLIEQAVKVHVTIHSDQKYHYLCLALVALGLAWR